MPSTQGVSSHFPELFWSSTDFLNFSTAPPRSSTRHPPVHPQPAPSNPGRTGAVRARLIEESLADRVDHSGRNAAITQVAAYSAAPAVHMLGIGPARSSRRPDADAGPMRRSLRPGATQLLARNHRSRRELVRDCTNSARASDGARFADRDAAARRVAAYPSVGA